MMKVIVLHYLICLVSGYLTDETQEARPGHVRVSASTGHVFKFFITPQYFNWSQDNTEAKSSLRRKNEAAMLRYRASLINQPSLPSWLKYHYSKDYKTGLLYGVPKLSAQYRLQIVATDRDTFETGNLFVTVNVQRSHQHQNFGVRLKIDNLNLEDVFDKQRTDRILNLFRSRFWENAAEDLHLTFVDSAINLGGRRPLKPTNKDGVIIELGSHHKFSDSLISLDKETEPLRKIDSCSYKRISVERYFRQAGLAVDWCSFRLVYHNDTVDEKHENNSAEKIKWTFPQKSKTGRRSRFPEILVAIIGPLLIFSLFCVFVGFLLWTDCGGEKDNTNVFIESLFDIFDCGLLGRGQGGSLEQQQLLLRNNNNSVEATATPKQQSCSPTVSHRDLRASSVQRQTETLRSLARRRDVTPRLQGTPTVSVDGSSIHSRSRTGSPCPSPCGSPLPRHSYNWEMFESLNRPNPPAYNSLPRGVAGPGGPGAVAGSGQDS